MKTLLLNMTDEDNDHLRLQAFVDGKSMSDVLRSYMRQSLNDVSNLSEQLSQKIIRGLRDKPFLSTQDMIDHVRHDMENLSISAKMIDRVMAVVEERVKCQR